MTAEPAPFIELARAAQRGLNVLVVEDHPVNRQVISLMLARIPAAVTCAENGVEGVEAFAKAPYDIVLMDLRMPIMDGYEAMRRIRAAEAAAGRPPTPIIVVSAHTTPLERARATEAGADHHIGKPIHVPTLLDAMDAVLALRAAPEADQAQA